jgi:SsrA-binding protein
MQAKAAPAEGGIKIVSENRKARFHYHIIETFEAGIVLTGGEIKSVREDGISLSEAYVRPEVGELLLLNAHIRPYKFSDQNQYDPVRARKLLLHKHEIDKLRGRVEQRGLTIVPLRMYLKRGRAKLEIALAKGKAGPDRRDDIKERDSRRELARALKKSK